MAGGIDEGEAGELRVHPAGVRDFEYSALAWGLAIDWLVWHTLPDQWMLAGAAIIIASGIYLVRHESVHAEAEHP
jgi:drug/metabolite transporter (DMT)-like permease